MNREMKCNGMKVVWCAVLAGGLGFLSVQAENVNEQKSDVRGSHCVSEKCAKPVSPEKENARKAARERFAADAAVFDRATRREIERLYHKVSSWSDESAEALKTLMEKYPKANRTGCAVMYAAQREKDPAERERLLKSAIASFGDCWYGDGAQVAPYARWYLAKLYERTGKPDEAKRLFDEIRTDYPNAVTHRGGPFAAWLPK